MDGEMNFDIEGSGKRAAEEKTKEYAIPILEKMVRLQLTSRKFNRDVKGIDSTGGDSTEVLELLNSGNAIKDLNLTPNSEQNGGHFYHFYIGKREYHIMGEAARKVDREILD